MPDETYNGWVNYETWCIFTWLSNEEAPYRMLKGLAQTRDLTDRQKEDLLKERIEQSNPLQGGSLYSDLLQRALGRVRWDEIIKAAKEW